MPRHTIKLHRFSLREKSHPFSPPLLHLFELSSFVEVGGEKALTFPLLREIPPSSPLESKPPFFPFVHPFNPKGRNVVLDDEIIAPPLCYLAALSHLLRTVIYYCSEKGAQGIKFPLKRVKSYTRINVSRFRSEIYARRSRDSLST